MGYTPIRYGHIKDRTIERVFRHADLYLADVYGIFQLPCANSDHKAEGNFTIVLSLVCVIDGLATYVHPTSAAVQDQEQRFKQLVRDELPWGPVSKRWLEISEAARNLYLEIRNPLVHELAQDKVTGVRRDGFSEPVIGKWGPVPKEFRDIAKIEVMTSWNSDWPAIFADPARQSGPAIKICAAGLYWAVKNMTQRLAAKS